MTPPLSKISFVLAVAAGFAAGVAPIVAAIVLKKPAFAFFGAAFLLGTAICAFTAKEGTPGGSLDPSVKATFKQIPDGATFVLFGLVVVAMVLTFIFPPWK